MDDRLLDELMGCVGGGSGEGPRRVALSLMDVPDVPEVAIVLATDIGLLPIGWLKDVECAELFGEFMRIATGGDASVKTMEGIDAGELIDIMRGGRDGL